MVEFMSAAVNGRLNTYRDARSARNRDDVVALSEQPRERDLSSRRVVLLRDRLDAIDDAEDPREVLLREAGQPETHVALLQVRRGPLGERGSATIASLCARSSTYDLASEETATEGRVCDDGDAQLPRGLQQPDLLVLDLE